MSGPLTDCGAAPWAGAALRALFASQLPVGLALLDREFRYLAINETLAQANGLSVEAHLGRRVAEVLPKAVELLEPLLRMVLDSGEALQDFEVHAEVPSLPGEASQWQASYVPVHDDLGQVQGILVQAVNRSLERRERLLRHQGELRLRRVLDSLFTFVGVLTPEGVLLEANKAPLEAAGLALDEVRGQPFWETPWWQGDEEQREWLRQAVRRCAGGETLRRDLVASMAEGRMMDLDFMIAPLRDDQGQITHLIPSAIDISARRSSESALRHSEDRFRRLFEGATVGMGLVDSTGRLLLANEAMAQMFGYARDELAGLPIHQLVPLKHRAVHADHVQHFMEKPALRYMAKRQELFALRKDGSEFAVEIGLNPMPELGGLQVLATISDVTERRAARQQIERALADKTVLLNEVHHRVKNNLQVISSLLNLQSRNADEALRRALRDSQSRVHSMALLHQLLYERSDFSALELGPYLRRLMRLLQDTYLGDSDAVQIVVDVPDEGARLDLQRAVPCGLVVNELVSNALKHAFADGRRGRLWLQLHETPQRVLEIADDGVGLPDSVRLGEVRSLGYQLLPLLVQQCGARLEIERDNGTRARLIWPMVEETQNA